MQKNVKIRINYISKAALILQTFFENNFVAIIYLITKYDLMVWVNGALTKPKKERAV